MFLSVDSIFHIGEHLEMPGEQHDRKTLESLRLVCTRFNSLLSRDRHLLQQQFVGSLSIDIVSSFDSQIWLINSPYFRRRKRAILRRCAS